MKRDRKMDVAVQCPYYRSDGKQAVYCEGVEDNCSLRLGFGSGQRKQAYKLEFCCEGWKTCGVAGMLNRKYDYEP